MDRSAHAWRVAAAALLLAACSPTPANIGTTAAPDLGMLPSDEGATVPEPPDASRPEVAPHVDTFGAPWLPADVETGPRQGGQAFQCAPGSDLVVQLPRGVSWRPALTVELWYQPQPKLRLSNYGLLKLKDTTRCGLLDVVATFDEYVETEWSHKTTAHDQDELWDACASSAASLSLWQLPMPDGSWRHIAFQFQEGMDEGHLVRLWHDGGEVPFGEGPAVRRAPALGPQPAALRVCRRELGTAFASDLAIDAIRISDTARYTYDFVPAVATLPDEYTIALVDFEDGLLWSRPGEDVTLEFSAPPQWAQGVLPDDP